MIDYLTEFKGFITRKLNEKILATAGKDPDYSEELILYLRINEAKALNMSTTTFLVFNLLPYTPTVRDVGYYSLSREIPVEIGIKTNQKDFSFWIMSQLEKIVFETGIDPFENVDIIKVNEVSFRYEEAINLYFPIYSFLLMVYYEQIV